MTRKTYRSMQGKLVDMELLSQKHELAPAIGNMRVNARGDELGPGGTIIRKREDIMAEYYENNPNAVADEQFVQPRAPVPPQITQPAPTSKPTQSRRTVEKKEVKTGENNQSNS